MEEREIGRVEHYFGKLSVAAIKITADTLTAGETIHIKGYTTDLTQQVDSIQIDRKPVATAKAGDDIGIRVNAHVREGDAVYKVTTESREGK